MGSGRTGALHAVIETVETLPARAQDELSYPCYDRWLTLDGEESLLFHRTENGYLLRFIDNADFVLDFASDRVICTPVPGMTAEGLADLHFNQIVPLVMGYRGELVLHASAVKTASGAIGFLGATGRGKSTLAAALARAGCPFLTDDGLIMDHFAGRPGYAIRPRRPLLRLRPDSEAAMLEMDEADVPDRSALKARFAARPGIPFCDEPVPLAALYILSEPHGRTAPEIHSLPPSAVLPELLSHSFILDVEDQARVHAHFDKLAMLAREVRCFTLDYPRDYTALPIVTKTIIDHAGIGGLNA